MIDLILITGKEPAKVGGNLLQGQPEHQSDIRICGQYSAQIVTNYHTEEVGTIGITL